MKTFCIGEDEPFRLTNTSARRLLEAVCRTRSTIITATVDSTCPPTHVCVRVSVPDANAAQFRSIFQGRVVPVEEAGGQS